MKTIICLLVFMFTASFSFGALINGGFETGDMTGWTSVYENPENNLCYVASHSFYSGGYALQAVASAGANDWTRTYAWSDFQDMSSATAITLQLTDVSFNDSNDYQGWGQEISLMLNDGTNQSSVLLAYNSQPPYGPSHEYTLSIGSDGKTWQGFDVALGDFNVITGFNLSNAKVGIRWETVSWDNAPIGGLWASSAVDDVRIIPEPPSKTITIFGLTFLLTFLAWKAIFPSQPSPHK